MKKTLSCFAVVCVLWKWLQLLSVFWQCGQQDFGKTFKENSMGKIENPKKKKKPKCDFHSTNFVRIRKKIC